MRWVTTTPALVFVVTGSAGVLKLQGNETATQHIAVELVSPCKRSKPLCGATPAKPAQVRLGDRATAELTDQDVGVVLVTAPDGGDLRCMPNAVNPSDPSYGLMQVQLATAQGRHALNDPTLTVDVNGDLPGPGATSLPSTMQLLP